MVDDDLLEDDDELLFADEEEETPLEEPSAEDEWRILIVDDEEEVHRVTRLVLDSISFDGKAMHFYHAYSGEEAVRMVKEIENIALIFLDVVMETDDAGLRAARRIREELQNPFVRIVLRTGQPGQAPEDKVIIDYDINDYKTKTELTSTKLFTAVIASLRSYRDIMIIEHNKRGLRKVIDASPTIFKMQSMGAFAEGVLEQLTNLLNLGKNALFCHGFAASRAHGVFYIRAATGEYERYVNHKVMEVTPAEVRELLMEALNRQGNVARNSDYVGYLVGKGDSEYLIYIHGWEELHPWDKDLIHIFFTNVSVAHDNILLNMEIEDTQSEVIYTLGEIAETRSKETGNHVKRVASYSELMALEYGLSEHEAKILRLASPMHDVGKLGIPDSILNKPARLTPEEWEIMKTHAQIGYEMLKHSSRPLMKAAAITAGQHHEKWDGTGYPAGLKGENIHIFGRITAVADVFDALSVRRVYKNAWPVEKVLALFQDERGKQFDPRLVDILVRNIDTFLRIRQENTDPWERGEPGR